GGAQSFAVVPRVDRDALVGVGVVDLVVVVRQRPGVAARERVAGGTLVVLARGEDVLHAGGGVADAQLVLRPVRRGAIELRLGRDGRPAVDRAGDRAREVGDAGRLVGFRSVERPL